MTNKSSSLHSETQLQSGVAGEKLKISESNSFQRKLGFYLCDDLRLPRSESESERREDIFFFYNYYINILFIITL